MHIYEFINQFDKAYGKTHQYVEWSVHSSSVFAKVSYAKNESFMIRIWLSIPENIHESNYEFILFKDNIYMNDYLMPDPEHQKQFFEAHKTFYQCYADLHINIIPLDPFDNKLLRKIYDKCVEHRNYLCSTLQNVDAFHKTPYDDSDSNFYYTYHLEDLKSLLPIEDYLAKEIKARGMKPLKQP